MKNTHPILSRGALPWWVVVTSTVFALSLVTLPSHAVFAASSGSQLLAQATPASDAAKAGAGSAGGTTAPTAAAAAPAPGTITTASTYQYQPPLGNASIETIIGGVIKRVMPFIGALFFFMFLWGGFLWMTAGGDSKKVKQAQDTLTSAMIGMAIVVFAYVLVYNVISILGAGVSK